jgi:RNA polymerase sigma-70 factor (ECF subfamily)
MVHEHTMALRRYALVLTRNADMAEDLVQETLAKAIAAADKFEPDTDLRVWLFRILHNTHISEVRKQQVRARAAVDLPEPVFEPDPTLRLEVRQVLEALDQLPAEQRDPIVLIALEGMSYADAAKSLNIPSGTLYSRLGRGRAALRRMMDEVRNTKFRVV